MVRTIITIPDEIKKWLDNYSHTHHQSLAETIRMAIKEYIEKNRNQEEKQIIKTTAGIWKDRKIDGLEYVNKIRKEW